MNSEQEKPNKKETWNNYRKTILKTLAYDNVYGQIKNQRESTDGWVTGLCPFHEDEHNSFTYNKKTLGWKCFACNIKGSVFDFIAKTEGKTFKQVLFELGDKCGVPKPLPKEPEKPYIREELAKEWHENLNEEMRRFLMEKNGLNDKTIDKYGIGWDKKESGSVFP